jgi:hypothetical protein
VLDFIAYTRDFIHLPKTKVQRSWVRRPQWLSNQTLLPNPTVLIVLTEKCSYMPTKMRGYAIFLQSQLSPDAKRNIF